MFSECVPTEDILCIQLSVVTMTESKLMCPDVYLPETSEWGAAARIGQGGEDKRTPPPIPVMIVGSLLRCCFRTRHALVSLPTSLR